MIYIGKIVNYGGNDGFHKYGFIEPLIGTCVSNVFFHHTSIPQNDSLYLKISPKCVNVKVLFECDENINSYNKRKAIRVIDFTEKNIITNFDNFDQSAKNDDIVFNFVFNRFPEKYINKEEDLFLHFDNNEVVKYYFEKYLPSQDDINYLKRYTDYIKKRIPRFTKPCILSFKFDDQPYEDIVQFVSAIWTYIPNERYIFIEKYPDLITEPGIIQWISVKDLNYILTNNIQISENQLKKIVKENWQIANYYKYKISIKEIISNPYLIDLIPEEKLIAEIENYTINDFIPILSYIQANKHPKCAISIASKIKTLEDLTTIWTCSTSSMKIKLLIFLSNPNKIKLLNRQLLTGLFNNENNTLVKAVLSLIEIYFEESSDNKNLLFEKFHNMLISYLVNEFNKDKFSKNEISTLIDKCINYQDNDIFYFCDARPWLGENGVFCPEGCYHIYSRSKCEYFNSLDFSKTEDRENKKDEYKQLSDMLLNLNYNPDIKKIKENQNAVNYKNYYPYLIAGFVNQLIQLKPHMKCKCGRSFTANFNYAKKVNARISPDIFDCTVFRESETQDTNDHDKSVYLNFCISCRNVIDSRECKIKDSFGYWLCMYCGSSYEYGFKNRKLKCPNCGTESASYLSFHCGLIQCKKCGHNFNNFKWKLFDIK